MTRLDDKLARIRAGADTRTDFIIADAKDPDMGPGLHAVGPGASAARARRACRPARNFSKSIEAVIGQDIVDIMLTSVSNLEKLVERKAFARSKVKPAIRANDTTDIWRHRGATYHHRASRPFRDGFARACRKPLTDLGLYSITFTNDLDADVASLEAFRGVPRGCGGERFLVFSRSLQSERGRRPRAGQRADVRQRRDRALPRRTDRDSSGRGSSRSPTTARRRWRSLFRSILASSSACWAAARGRHATASSSSIRRRNTARGSRCSAARSISPSRRSTSCG